MIGLAVRLEALDPILFGENRAARAGEDHALRDQDPSPLTVYGAVGARVAAAYGVSGPRDWPEVEPVLGPFRKQPGVYDAESFALAGYAWSDASSEPWFPAPRHVRFRGGRLQPVRPFDALRPAELPEGAFSSAGGRWRLAADADPEDEAEGAFSVDRWLLERVLAGAALGTRSEGVAEAGKAVYRPEGRVGLAIDNRSGVAVEGRLFSRPYRRFEAVVDRRAGGWRAAGLMAWVSVRGLAGRSVDELSGVGFLGGDRGRAELRFSEGAPLGDLRAAVEGAVAGSEGFFLYLLTPALAESAWPEIDGVAPLVTAVGRPRWVSGWNVAANRPRVSRVLVPEGSVAFYRWPEACGEEEARRKLVGRWWLGAVAREFSNEGFGRVLVGVWGGGRG